MLFDFDSPDCPAPPHADVCILGAGAAGVALATELAAAGKSVVLLEGGGREQEPRSQTLYDSNLTGQPHRGIHEGRFRTYGGTTTRWGGQILELQPLDFERRDWVAGSGWPFPKSDLTTFYERALHYVGLRRVPREDQRVWQEIGLNPPDLNPELQSLLSRWLPERNVATLHARTLGDTRRLKVFTHAGATGFELNPARDAIAAVLIRGFSGRTANVTATHFVICLGGIESTRLLLQPPTEGTLPWQQNGLLGKHYQDHIGVNNIPVTALTPREPWKLFGYFHSEGFRYHHKLWLSPAEQQRLQTLNVAGTLGPFSIENPQRDEVMNRLRDMVRKRRRPGLGEAFKMLPDIAAIIAGRLDERYRGEAPKWKRIMLTVHSEQSPTSASTLSLSPDRDELGMFRTQLNWQISDAELHTIRSYVRIATETFARHHFGTISAPPNFFTDDALLRSMCGDSYHHMGGTRMSTSPAEGIVDTDLRLHGIANAYVCSASVFPTTGFSNPTHTVLALAMRLADKLSSTKERLVATEEKLVILSEAKDLLLAKSVNNTQRSPRYITLPNSNATTTQLGFGTAYLLGPGLDAQKSHRLLDAAWDAGIRHFDTARLYGHGQTEALLGDFLQRHPEATVTTKFGVIPATTFDRTTMAAQRLVPALGKLLPKRNDKATFRARDARAALETSLRALRRDRVELFLLHEAEAHDLAHDDLLEFLHGQRALGMIGNFGFGGEYYKIPALLKTRAAYLPVLQFERSAVGPHLDTGAAWHAQYRTFASLARALRQLFDREPLLLEHWSQLTQAELAEPDVLGRLLLKASLEDHPAALTLFSTGSEAHIFSNAEVAADSTLATPAKALSQLLRENDWGLGAALYPPLP